MGKYSKAIAAVISSVLALLVTFGLISPAVAESFGQLSGPVAAAIVALLTALGVLVAPANDA